MDDALSNQTPRHRIGVAAVAALTGSTVMALMTAFTEAPNDLVAAAGVVVMRLAYAPYWLELARLAGGDARRGWFVVESFVYGLAIVGFYRVVEQLFGLAWR